MMSEEEFEATLDHIATLEALWDVLSDTIESGRLCESDIPDDYKALVEWMVACAASQEQLIRVQEADDLIPTTKRKEENSGGS